MSLFSTPHHRALSSLATPPSSSLLRLHNRSTVNPSASNNAAANASNAWPLLSDDSRDREKRMNNAAEIKIRALNEKVQDDKDSLAEALADLRKLEAEIDADAWRYA